MLTRRDLLTAAVTASVTLSAVATIGHVSAADPPATVQQSALFDWNTIEARSTEVGQYRQFMRAPTATLDELEIHVTTLNPGIASHPPHRHPNEELVILDSGKLEATVNGKIVQLGPGSVIFNATNQLHGVKNIGDTPATYHVINWTSPGQKVKAAAAKKP
jgi:quercetin dioxygenase-like cupin family protein